MVDGVFEEVPGGADAQSSPTGVVFHPTTGIDADAVAQVQATLRRRILRAFVGRGLLEKFEAKEMLGYQHSASHPRQNLRCPSAQRTTCGRC